MNVLSLSPGRTAALAAILAVGILGGSVALRAQVGAPILQPAVVLGAGVSLSWTAVPGASQYVLRAGAAPGAYQLAVPVGNVTAVQVAAPAVGTYYAAVQAVDGAGAPLGSLSNEVAILVSSMFVPPAAPTNLQTFLNGATAIFTWTLGTTGGGAPTNMYLQAGTTPGASDVGTFPVGLTTQAGVPGVPGGTYYVRVYARNGGGFSPASNEVTVNMPVGGACTAPPAQSFNSVVFGRYVQFSWPGLAGASGYRLDVSQTPGGPTVLSQSFPGTQTGLTVTGAPLGVFYGKLTTAFQCGTASQGPEQTITIDGAPPPGPRTPNPAPGTRLPLPNRYSLVQAMARAYPADILHSCREHGGNNNFMFRLVRELRREDTRWGLNWKRGNRGDMSQDIVTFNYGSEPDEDTTQTYIVDVLSNHCGSGSAGPFWLDQTEETARRGTIGRWTLLPYIQAGYPISPQ